MIILGVVIKIYTICTFATVLDETWNMTHPRPYPKQHYYMLQWEELDFYKVNNQWILRKYRKTDSETKQFLRKKYWRKYNE